MSQTSLAEYVQAPDKAGLLTRIKEETRVDELPMLMERNPDVAVYVEKVKDSPFPFLANAYGARPMYALALDKPALLAAVFERTTCPSSPAGRD
jgi:2,5-furandicarboxylate decarboxylase 1